MNTDIEKHILEVAKKVFLKRGLAGTRLQEIANEAGVGRTALHYYFRNKEKLFQVVWTKAFEQIASRANFVFNPDSSIFEKMKQFVDGYFESALLHPEYDLFILSEFNQNPNMMKDIFLSGMSLDSSNSLLYEIEKAVKNNELKGDPVQVLITLLSLCIHPFAGKSIIQVLLNLNDEEFLELMKNRKYIIHEFIEKSFR
ncbi:TetR/AcrR family transcriptional regulator [Flavobacterium ajazii]|uniref:TetR/AcrR family transcriptional regulator n=1 Tax=Flavobacterium ajazii TaxID=2692318 RepID=UPI0013D1F908|nr:TetR/AcrR family transcriptional regulator [Flavobacterium ajazii]